MRYIQKSTEPESLTKYKKQKGAYFDGYDKKDDVRRALLKEQGYVCGYCMRRLETCEQVKIEHILPQSMIEGDERAALDYRIMLGVCYGNKGHRKKEQTCDAHRGNEDLTINPYNKTAINMIKYKSDGTIYSDDEAINKDLDITLNLNYNGPGVYLKDNRKEALEACKKKLHVMQSQGLWSKNILLRILDEYERPDKEGKVKAYSGIVIEYLKRRIEKSR